MGERVLCELNNRANSLWCVGAETKNHCNKLRNKYNNNREIGVKRSTKTIHQRCTNEYEKRNRKKLKYAKRFGMKICPNKYKNA